MLIDTSGFFSIHSEADIQHAKADEIYNQAWFRLTTNYVLNEFVALAMVRKLSAVSFVVMRERNITEALTTDHHFEQENFIRLLK